MLILGISAFYHDSAAALIQDGRIIAAAQEERFTRKKHDPGFPKMAVQYCLDFAGITLDDLDAVAFYDKPFLKFERLLETYYGFAPRGLASFIKAMPVWLKEKLFLKRLLYQELATIQDYNKKEMRLLFPEHHLSHAASAFYPSSYEQAAILTIDGVGEWATASIANGDGKNITALRELHFPHSLGLLYSAFTYFLGFRVNSGEYKLMGLAPYGNPNDPKVEEYIQTIKTKLIDIKEDGSIWLNQEYFNYAVGLRMARDKKWEELFGFPKRPTEVDLEQHHCDLGLAIQKVTEEVVLKMAAEAKRLTQSDYLCMAGGVALNCVANGVLLRSGLFKDVFIQPAAGDAGGAPGAALAAYHLYFEQERKLVHPDAMAGSLLGPDFSEKEMRILFNKYKSVGEEYDNIKSLSTKVAALINDGHVVGWVQGRMEFGPRALGARSIIGDPRNEAMQKKLNLKIKYRESFRPFAPLVLEEECGAYFQDQIRSPYMLMVQPVNDKIKNDLPSDYHQLPLRKKLYHQRSSLPAITHVDFSARIQTVAKEPNSPIRSLLEAFKELTGCPVLINTSFNVRGEPIVCTPEDAYRCFMRTDMDYLAVGNYLFAKTDQPEWTETADEWKKEFVLD